MNAPQCNPVKCLLCRFCLSCSHSHSHWSSSVISVIFLFTVLPSVETGLISYFDPILLLTEVLKTVFNDQLLRSCFCLWLLKFFKNCHDNSCVRVF